MAGEGLSLFASAGNEADLSVLDYMEYAIRHEPTKVIALLIDSLPETAPVPCAGVAGRTRPASRWSH